MPRTFTTMIASGKTELGKFNLRMEEIEKDLHSTQLQTSVIDSCSETLRHRERYRP